MQDRKDAEPVKGHPQQDNQGIKLDYKIKDPEERKALVQQILNSFTPDEPPSARLLEILADYLIFPLSKEDKKKKIINTQNRMVTINKRETSFQGLVSKFQNGEDGIYSLISDNGKNTFLTHKIAITDKDLQDIPILKEFQDTIKTVQKQFEKATGRDRFLLKKQIIQMRKDQYVIKMAYKQPILSARTTPSFSNLDVFEDVTVSADGEVTDSSLISLMNPEHVMLLLCDYNRIKGGCMTKVGSDMKWLIQDFQSLVKQTLQQDYPLYYDLLRYKIAGKTNAEIQSLLDRDFGIRYTMQYISSLWRNKIPKLIAQRQMGNYIIWYYKKYKNSTEWKTCSLCKETKPAINRFFSKNNTAKDGLYSRCKKCRNKKPDQRRLTEQEKRERRLQDGSKEENM